MSRALILTLLSLGACLSRDQRDKAEIPETGIPETDDSSADDSAPPDDSAPDDSSPPVDADNDGTPAGEDCDDSDPDRHPGVPEVCDGVDQDCDGVVDDEPTDGSTWYFDGDSDGYGVPNPTMQACTQPTGYAANAEDCNDNNAAINPGEAELWQPRNNLDDDCNGYIDEIQVPAARLTIQLALADAWDGATILVAAGTRNEFTVVPDLDLLIISEDGPEATILDASGTNQPVISVAASGGSNVVTISGFTLTGGSAVSTFGGAGLSCDRATVVAHDLIIRDNEAGYNCYGGGIGVQYCDFTLRQSIVAANSSGMAGGGINARYPDPLTLENVLLVDNQGGYSGGGLYTYDGVTVVNQSTIVGNSATDSGAGGGIAVATITTRLTVTNSILAYNTSENQGGGLYTPADDYVQIEYSLAYGNTNAGVSSNIYGTPFLPADGNLTGDPIFTTWLSSTPWTRWDLHLNNGSPAIDTGDPAAYDTDGSRADIGAFGGPSGAW